MHTLKKTALLSLAGLLAISSITPAEAKPIKNAITACPITATYTITARSTGWQPTNQATSFLNGPYSFAFSGTHTYTTANIYTGSTSIVISDVIAAANAAYGAGTYANPSSVTATWDWSGSIPASYARLLVLHRGDKITFTEVQDNANCTSTTTSGLVAYLPLSASSQSNYCRIVDVSPAKTNWSATCTD